jgi:addiction module RelE/StbE family toxin
LTWNLAYTKNFLRQFRKLENTPYFEKVQQVIDELAKSQDPRKLGAFKRGSKYSGYYYELDRSYRLVYDIIDKELTVLMLDVGDHKQVYRKD